MKVQFRLDGYSFLNHPLWSFNGTNLSLVYNSAGLEFRLHHRRAGESYRSACGKILLIREFSLMAGDFLYGNPLFFRSARILNISCH
jgi:hypothetical protein